MAYVVKVKVDDVEKALAEVRPNHRLVAVHSYVANDPVEYAGKNAERVANAEYGFVGLLPMLYNGRDLYFEEYQGVYDPVSDPFEGVGDPFKGR